MASSGPAPEGDDGNCYELSALTRPTADWEISRDHVYFGTNVGFDTKLNSLQLIERPSDGRHGGVLLLVSGNTVQLLTLIDFTSPPEPPQRTVYNSSITYYLHPHVHSRRPVFGLSGSGIGAVCVHPSGAFFAVGEKGAKPHILVYKYPSLSPFKILRRGTEQAFSCLSFSHDGELLASVGSAPDYLLTIWDWQSETTVLRCKAFGQDVAGVAFSSNDKGFLATSGVAHIRVWKMAATFTGLKLQGEIGKFGKTELSDVAAFCILPDKKVLSGSDRGALLLWEGPTIKCELRISEEELPHTGEITVVQLQVSTRRILTAGVDGKMKFWSLDEVDGADLPPDGHFALVSCQEQVDVGHAIQCVARIEGDTYMVQGLNGGLDRIVCGEQLIVEKDYIPNDSGVMTAVVCSPYEHLAASCGQDGAVRAWDYTIQRCVFLETFSSPASCITWVPTASSFRNVDLGASRQVAVGFNDGVVRVLLLDMPRRRIVRTNVLKPHKDRVNRLCFSLSGKFLATASSDHSFFLFKTQPSAQSTPSTPYPPEYLPLGFVHLSSAAMDVSWRPDDEALLATLEDGSLVEYDLPEATLNELVEQAEAETRGAIPRASLEIRLDSRCLGALESVRPMTTPELDALVKDNEGLGALSPDAEEAVKKRFTLESNAKVKVRAAAYVSNKSFLLGTSSPFQSKLLHASFDGSEVLHRYPSDALASIESICTSYSTNFLLVGLSNGKIHIRSTKLPHAFLSAEFHDATPDGILGTSDRVRAQRLRACMSFDDTYLLSCGVDGNLCVLRLEPDKIERAARRLHESHHVLLKEADIVADQAQDKQQTVLDQIKKKKESEESEVTYSSNDIPDLTSMPVFHRAKAYNSYIQSKLIPSVDSEDEERMPGVGKDEEMFKGVTRLLNHPSTNLSPEAPPADGNAVHLREAMDLKDASKAYTIEESRQKTDADARAEAVKNNQEQTKEAMKSLRAKFQEIVERDRQLPEESRVSSDEWLLDVEYKELLERQGEAAIEEVKKEFAYDQEKSDKLLSKMTEEFLDPVAVELINVHSLSSDVCVQTFRTMQMHPNLHRRLTELKFQGTNDTDTKEYSTPPSVLHILAHEEIPLPPSFPLQESERRLLTAARCASAHSPTRLKGNQREKESVHGFEARKQKRLERKSRLAQWVDQKPREDADDARDVVATAFAARNVGDYKLKTASDYVVPGHQRVNAAKKRKQLAFLEEALHNARLQFNAQVLKLRDVKIPLVYALKRDQERMGLLRQALGVQGKMVEYTIAKDEWPEQREDVTVEDIDQYTRTQQVSLPRDKLQAVEQEGVAAYIARWKKELVVSEEDDDEHVYEVLMEVLQDALCTKNPYMSDPVQLACEADPSLLVLRHLSLKAASDPLKNSVQDDSPEAAITTYRLEQELRELESRIGHRIRLYDAAVQSLRKTRGALDISLKQTELQLLTLRSELTLLEELEYQEDALTSKLEKAQNDKDTILFDLETVQEAMDGKKSELETWQTQEKSVQAEFIGLVSVNNGSTTSSMANMMHPAYTALQKIFKKRLKRVKKKVNEEEEEEDEEEEEEDGEEESDEDDSDEDESDEEGEEDICPPGCDPVLYDQVLALREKRQDADDMILELTKALDEHKKSGERLTTKLRQIDKELQATEVDIQRFQSEKQRRFNELQVVRALSCHQLRSLQYLDGWTLPDDASDCLLFSLSTFERLASRVKSLKSENQSLRQQFRDLHRQQRSLSKEKQAQQQEVARMEEKSNQLQRLKFGRLVDLSVLDAGSEMTSVEDLRKKVNTKESAASKEVNQRHGEQLDVKKSLLDATERNTQLLNRVAELSERKMALERMLDHAQSQTQESTGDENEESKKEVEVKERRKLVKLVKLQAREVEALRQEIGLLKGKDGKVYFLQQK